MTDSSPPPLYWDANLLLAYLEGTPGRFQTVRGIIVRAKNGEVRLATSMISVAEVAFAGSERASGSLDATIRQAIDVLWADGSIDLIDVSLGIALAARDIVRRSLVDGPRLKPMDAIHLATAQAVRASVFHTYDLALQRHSGRHGFAVTEP